MDKKITIHSLPVWARLLHAFSTLANTLHMKGTSLVEALIVLVMLLNKTDGHIILADDDEEDQELFKDAVQEIEPKIKISAANNGDELMRLLLKDAIVPDVIFLDLNMPFKNGQECLAEIRSNEKLKSIPVIIYTTSNNKKHIDDTYSSGADYYISKPNSFKDLKLIIKKMLSREWNTHTQPIKEQFVVSAN